MNLRLPSRATSALAGVIASVTFIGTDLRDAHACGGCFHPAAEVGSSVVTDHRMVFKISVNETILWDQVRYTGSPEEFAWVLPVRDGAKVELSRDAWIAALDATTQTSVTGPERFCGGGGGGGGGCGSFSSESAFDDNAAAPTSSAADAGFRGNGQVSVVSQGVIGPYQAVTLRANAGEGISEWLTANGFAIPDEVKPTVDAYTAERFDFIALRLRPGQGVQAMRPVRVVSPGADATLPLRMVAAGVGAKVGLTLWVLGEGRYRTQNFANAIVDDDRLLWDGATSRSNLTSLQSELLAGDGGRTWLTEMAGRIEGSRSIVPSGSLAVPVNLSLYAGYNSQCITRPPQQVPCDEDELPPATGTPRVAHPSDAGSDAGPADAGDDPAEDAGADASDPTPPPVEECLKTVSGCEGFDDFEVATRGIHAGDLWVTRLRADLPVSALATDLRLEAAEQTEVPAQHHTEKFTDPTFDPCAGVSGASSTGSDDDGSCACRTSRPLGSTFGMWLIVGLTAALTSQIARRHRRR